jgi:BON domain
MAARRALVLLLMLLVSGGCSLAGRTLNDYVDDRRVKGAVKRRLADTGVSRRGGVNVDTFDGTVYLSGTVETEIQKSDAEIAAWKAGGVEQVVNDLVVRRDGGEPAAASPTWQPRHPLRERLRGVALVEPGRTGGPDLAYDARGRLIATVYLLSSRDLVDRDIEALRGEGRAIDHVTVFALVSRPELPGPHYAVVLWHVSESEAAALR